jgi:hypothetical protein
MSRRMSNPETNLSTENATSFADSKKVEAF